MAEEPEAVGGRADLSRKNGASVTPTISGTGLGARAAAPSTLASESHSGVSVGDIDAPDLANCISTSISSASPPRALSGAGSRRSLSPGTVRMSSSTSTASGITLVFTPP